MPIGIPQKWGSEFFVNSRVEGDLWDPDVAALADGRFAVTYQEAVTRLAPERVFAQVFEGNGSKTDGELRVSNGTAGEQSDPSIAALRDGGFVVAYFDTNIANEDAGDSAIRAQHYDNDGNRVGTAIRVDTLEDTMGGIWNLQPSVGALADGGFAVAYTGQGSFDWTKWDTHNDGVVTRAFSSDYVDDMETGVTRHLLGDQNRPKVAGLSDGRYVVVYNDDYPSSGDGSGWAVNARLYNADGSAVGSVFPVNGTTQGNQNGAAVAALPGGRFVVAYSDDSETGGDTSGSAVRGQVFNSDGSTSGGEFLINSTTAGDQSGVSVAALTDGRFVAVYTDDSETGADSSGTAVRGQVFYSDGSTSGDEFLVNTTTDGDQTTPVVAGLADGRFVVTFVDRDPSTVDPEDDALLAQIFDPRLSGVFLRGTQLGDQHYGTEFRDRMKGANGNDRLDGEAGNDILRGQRGNDVLLGREDNDSLFGGGQKDRLKGGNGDDVLVGGPGLDLLTGGKGADLFLYQTPGQSRPGPGNRDLIRDFEQGSDKIDLSRIDAVQGGSDNAFAFVGTTPFSNTAGEFRVVKLAHYTLVRGDIDGDGQLDFDIALKGAFDLTAADFIL